MISCWLDDMGFEEKLAKMRPGEVGLVLTSTRKYADMNLEAIRTLTSRRWSGIYVTVNRPFSALLPALKAAKINTDRLLFIDAITQMVGGRTEKADNVIYIGSPGFLTELSIAISQAATALPKGDRFVYFDSISNLLVYNNPGTVTRFIHFLTGKIRDWEARGIFIALGKESNELLQFVTQFVDETIEVK